MRLPKPLPRLPLQHLRPNSLNLRLRPSLQRALAPLSKPRLKALSCSRMWPQQQVLSLLPLQLLNRQPLQQRLCHLLVLREELKYRKPHLHHLQLPPSLLVLSPSQLLLPPNLLVLPPSQLLPPPSLLLLSLSQLLLPPSLLLLSPSLLVLPLRQLGDQLVPRRLPHLV